MYLNKQKSTFIVVTSHRYVVGCLALSGFNMSPDVYAWIIVFVLPINSAINPFLYTLMAAFRRRKVRKAAKV